MKPLTFTHWLPWLLIAVCPPLLGQCGGAVEHGTETGNPPVVEQQKLHIVLGSTGVEVVGDAGAVSPGASVSVTNRTTGAHVEATAAADGSVSIVVPGSLQDEYEVTVSNSAGSQTVQIAAQTSGGGAGAGGSTGTSDTASAGSTGSPSGPDPAVCASLGRTLGARVAAGFANADKSCQGDEDCDNVTQAVDCSYSCDQTITSRSGAEVARAAITQDIAPLCTEFRSQGCAPVSQPCALPGTLLACNDGTCTKLSSLSCDDIPKVGGARAANAVRDTSRSCSRDSDCALTRADLSCVPNCGNVYYSVAASALEGLTNSIAQTEGLYCGGGMLRGCPAPVQLPCVPPLETPEATCTAGQCEVRYVPLP